MKKPIVNVEQRKSRRLLDRVEGFESSLGKNTVFKGVISGKGHCIVYGAGEGECLLDGTFVIAESGSWVGKIDVENLIIAGKVDGELKANSKIEILSSARVKGQIESVVMAIAEGAVHEGEIKMSPNATVTRFVDKRD